MPEVFLRLYGLTSVSSAVAMALMVAIPFLDNRPLPLIWLVLAAVPYYLLYARDLESCGYRRTDVLRMYSFNLLLIPVSISGMLKSLRQAFTGEPSPFIRTPKVPGRTAAPATYTLIPALAMPWMVYVAIVGFRHSGYAFLVFGSVNVAALLSIRVGGLHSLPIRMGRCPVEFQYAIFLVERSASPERAVRTIARGSPRVSGARLLRSGTSDFVC